MSTHSLRRWALLVPATTLSLALAGCSKAPETPPVGSPTTGTGAPAPARPTDNPTDPPSTPPEGTEFTFDQAARYDDGVTVEVATIHAGKVSPTQTGADGTGGSIVTAEIVVTNNSGKSFVTDTMVIHGYYSGVGAPKIVDSSGAVGDSMKGTVPPEGRANATFAFAMPADQLDDVTIMVDGGDDTHGPVQFKGKVDQG